MANILYQGAPTSYSEIATKKFFGKDSNCIGVNTFAEIYELLEAKSAYYAAIPIENSVIGPIWENDDLLPFHDVEVVGEHYLRIEHCLLSTLEGNIGGLKKVLSHPKALEQCRKFFRKHPWIEPVVHFDTAGAAREIAISGNIETAAIASSETAAVYGLTILQKNLEDNPQNFTRFIFIRQKRAAMECDMADKCSLVFSVQHQPGTLHHVLAEFADKKVNITRIASRPMLGRPFEEIAKLQFGAKSALFVQDPDSAQIAYPKSSMSICAETGPAQKSSNLASKASFAIPSFEYLFYIDCEFVAERKKEVEMILEKMKQQAAFFKLLGFYKRGNDR